MSKTVDEYIRKKNEDEERKNEEEKGECDTAIEENDYKEEKEFHNRNADDEYDAFVDSVISSEGFKNCPFKDKEDRCYFSKEFMGAKTKCWHMSKCPKGRARVLGDVKERVKTEVERNGI